MGIKEDAEERRRELLEITQDEVGKARVGFGDDSKLQKEVVPINVLGIDSMLGGGLQRGRMAMVIGQESTGKTLFTQWVIRAFQERGDICGFIDPEKTFAPEWFSKTGVNVKELLVVQPAHTEQAFDLASIWAEKGMGLIVIDSLAALTPKARTDLSLSEQEFMGLFPRKINEGLNTFTNKNLDAVLLCTNQMRTKLGVVYGSPDEIPGGKAQKYYASYVIQVRRKGWITEGKGKRRVGYYMKLETSKNKTYRPFQETVLPFMYSGMVDEATGLVELAIDLGLIDGSRGRYVWRGEKIHGAANLTDMFRENSDQLDVLRDMVQYGSGDKEFE